MSYIYIASPYSHPDPQIRIDRYNAAMKYTAHLLEQNIHCFSPIVHSHIMANVHDLPMASEFWRGWNFTMLDPAKELHVLMLEGWAYSKGLDDEITRAGQLEIEIMLVHPDSLYN